jgi:hypothetical protein
MTQAVDPIRQQEKLVSEITKEISIRLRGRSLTPKVAEGLLVAIADEILKVADRVELRTQDGLNERCQAFGDAFFKLGRANTNLAQSYFSMNPSADGGGPFDAAVDRVITRVDKHLKGENK